MPTSAEPFTFTTEQLPFTIQDFFRWYASNLLCPPTREAMAEFLVGQALGVGGSQPPFAYGGHSVEVKSCARLSGTANDIRINRLSFDMRNTQSEYCVFCVLTETDIKKVNPMKTEQWLFFFAAVKDIIKTAGERRFGVDALASCGAAKCDYVTLKQTVDRFILRNGD